MSDAQFITILACFGILGAAVVYAFRKIPQNDVWRSLLQSMERSSQFLPQAREALPAAIRQETAALGEMMSKMTQDERISRVVLDSRLESIATRLSGIGDNEEAIAALNIGQQQLQRELERMRRVVVENAGAIASRFNLLEGRLAHWNSSENDALQELKRHNSLLADAARTAQTLIVQLGTVAAQSRENGQILQTVREHVASLVLRMGELGEAIRHCPDAVDEKSRQYRIDMESRLSELQNTVAERIRQYQGEMDARAQKYEERWQEAEAVVRNFEMSLEPLRREIESWQEEPLARRRDLDRKKIAVLIDFENMFIALWKGGLEVVDYAKFRKFLVDPQQTGNLIDDRVILFTNKSRWRRGGYYDKKLEIPYEYATNAITALKDCEFRIIEPDSNVDIPLTLLAVALAEKSEFEEFNLVANDGTYAGLVTKLSDSGCMVRGILIGDVAGDLIACYNELGFKKYQIKVKNLAELEKLGLGRRSQVSNGEIEEVEESPCERLGRWARQNYKLAIPRREEREKYLNYLFELFAAPLSMADMRTQVKTRFPETTSHCRYTLGKVLIGSQNVLLDEKGMRQRTIHSPDTWLKNAEIAWLKLVATIFSRLKSEGELTDLQADWLLEEAMEYEPQHPFYRELLDICRDELNKFEKQGMEKLPEDSP